MFKEVDRQTDRQADRHMQINTYTGRQADTERNMRWKKLVLHREQFYNSSSPSSFVRLRQMIHMGN
jgi:hypothetical protein